MCFYIQKKFSCGDFRWGKFVQNCNNDYRLGETCGLKLVYATAEVPTECRLCEKIAVKSRRRAAEIDRANRYMRDGGKLVASIDRSQRAVSDLESQIQQLERERVERRIGFGQTGSAPRDTRQPQVPSKLPNSGGAGEDVLDNNMAYTDSGYVSALNSRDAKREENPTRDTETLIEADARTEYSEVSTIAGQRLESAVSELADDLFKRLFTLLPSEHTMRKIVGLLPDALKAFALRVGYNAPTQKHRDIMLFIHKHRYAITASFWNRYSDDTDLLDTSTRDEPNRPLQEAIMEWLQKLEDDPAEDHSSLSEAPEWNDDIEHYDDTDLAAYRNFILQSPAYKWLLGRLLKETHLDTAEASIMVAIRQRIIAALPVSRNISRKRSSEIHKVTFDIDWDPIRFITAQRYEGDPAEAVERCITLTGSINHAQALTCGEYLRQTWPFSGHYMVEVLKEMVAGGPLHIVTRTLPDKSSLMGVLTNSNSMFEAVGPIDYVAEIGEQIAWVGAALRASPDDSGVGYSEPYIENIRPHGQIARSDDGGYSQKYMTWIDYRINYRISPCRVPDNVSLNNNGACWHDLFRNPVLVPGFPIPYRTEKDSGLEIPFEIMIMLAQAQRATLYKGKLCLKAFAAILVPTKRADGFVLWHMILNRNGDRISYSDHRIPKLPGLYPDGLSLADLHTARHILGWCAQAEDLTGAPGANYDIGWSKLGRPDPDCGFEKVSVTRGKLITGGSPVAIGLKDRPAYIQADNYAAQVRWIARKYVVLYDTGDQRAWFVDGVSTLLHIVRASLKEDEKECSNFQFLVPPRPLVEASQSINGKAAAISVLMNPANRALKLYNDTGDGCEAVAESKMVDNRFEDRVNQIYHTLEQIFDHQAQVNVELANGLRSDSSSSTRRLEGFDLMDIAAGEDQFWSHMALLEQEHVGWIGFTQSVHAITLFGRGFGQLIRAATVNPHHHHRVCPSWLEVPKGKNVLTSCVSHLTEILRKRGNPDANPWQLVEGTYWHMLDKAFEDCQGGSSNSDKCCDRIQLLIASSQIIQCGTALISPSRLEKHGAVIFGPSWPIIEDEDTDMIIDGDTFPLQRYKQQSIDSGIGSSLQSMADSQDDENSRKRHKKPSVFQSSSTPSFLSLYASESRSPRSRKRPLASPDHDKPNHRIRTANNRLDIVTTTDLQEDNFERTLVAPTLTPGFAPTQQHQASQSCTVTTPPDLAYRVGWICALKAELDAALRMLDTFYGRGFGHGSDTSIYTLGRIGEHNVVIACLPMGRYGNNSAAIVATRMTAKFPNIQIGLMVGIGGGIPPKNHHHQQEKEGEEVGSSGGGGGEDIRLGDIVVSKPSGASGGVIQYDLGKITADGLFRRTGYLNAPPEIVLQVLNLMPAHSSVLGRCWVHGQYPGEEADVLYDATYTHKSDSGMACTKACDPARQIARVCGNRERGPRVFYGTIASGNAVIKDAYIRDQLGKSHGALCFEMEAAGVMHSTFPCIVIRGISDYADSHKTDAWIEYAAATAAGYARAFLYTVPPMV
ncbi:hypothetical protein BJY01DRAFT_256478 [Aspergillus pseudoustus]|uniref:Nucleoside phosphorylase domain-containing protein n=1 Tax=Aspergillus pseudoustus TaxID=1810923 RepID=A0ABR4IAN2_9EURO